MGNKQQGPEAAAAGAAAASRASSRRPQRSTKGRAREPLPACFSKSDVKDLKETLKRMRAAKQREEEGEDAWVELSDLEKLPELSFNPFVGRIAEIVFDEIATADLEDNELNLDIFAKVVSIFHPDTPVEVKQQYAFKAFDNDEDGSISRKDFIYVMSCIHPGLPISELEEQADLVFEAAGREGHASLTPQDFAKLFDYSGFETFFTINL